MKPLTVAGMLAYALFAPVAAYAADPPPPVVVVDPNAQEDERVDLDAPVERAAPVSVERSTPRLSGKRWTDSDDEPASRVSAAARVAKGTRGGFALLGGVALTGLGGATVVGGAFLCIFPPLGVPIVALALGATASLVLAGARASVTAGAGWWHASDVRIEATRTYRTRRGCHEQRRDQSAHDDRVLRRCSRVLASKRR